MAPMVAPLQKSTTGRDCRNSLSGTATWSVVGWSQHVNNVKAIKMDGGECLFPELLMTWPRAAIWSHCQHIALENLLFYFIKVSRGGTDVQSLIVMDILGMCTIIEGIWEGNKYFLGLLIYKRNLVVKDTLAWRGDEITDVELGKCCYLHTNRSVIKKRGVRRIFGWTRRVWGRRSRGDQMMVLWRVGS